VNFWVDVVFELPPDTAPPAIAEQVPVDGATTVDPAAAVRVTFDEAVDLAAAKSATLTQGVTSVPAAVTWVEQGASGGSEVVISPDAPLAPSTTYTVSVSVQDLVGNRTPVPLTSRFTTAAAPGVPGVCPCGVFDDVDPGGVSVARDGIPVEVGMRFTPAESGQVSGVQFLKRPGHTGTHVVSLWSPGGVLLARATVTGESTAGWQSAAFSEPVAVTAGSAYTVSYTSPSGQYAYTRDGFGPSGISRPPLSTVASAGAFTYSAGSFPASSSTLNFWVDVIFRRP
jgi:hypothetical protein